VSSWIKCTLLNPCPAINYSLYPSKPLELKTHKILRVIKHKRKFSNPFKQSNSNGIILFSNGLCYIVNVSHTHMSTHLKAIISVLQYIVVYLKTFWPLKHTERTQKGSYGIWNKYKCKMEDNFCGIKRRVTYKAIFLSPLHITEQNIIVKERELNFQGRGFTHCSNNKLCCL